MQVIGVGSQDDFGYAQNFLSDTGLSGLTMLWERSGRLWRISDVRINSRLELYSYDLSRVSDQISFNDNGRNIVLDASVQEPWAPPGSPNLLTAAS